MDWSSVAVRFSDEGQTFEQVDHLALAIRAKRDGELHVGLIYRNAAGKLQYQHMAWHHMLLQSDPDPVDTAIEFPLHPVRADLVALYLELVHETNMDREVPYGLRTPENAFDPESGTLVLDGNVAGLTCVSFVLMIFQAKGHKLFKFEEWEERPGDLEFQEWVVKALRQSSDASEAHIKHVESEIGTIRYRPEDLALVGLTHNMPLPFEIAKTRGDGVKNGLRAYRLSRDSFVGR